MAYEKSTPPIRCYRDPVPSPGKHLGPMSIGSSFLRVFHEEAMAVTFTIPVSRGPDDFEVTYHRAPLGAGMPSRDMINVIIDRFTVMTWEIVKP